MVKQKKHKKPKKNSREEEEEKEAPQEVRVGPFKVALSNMLKNWNSSCNYYFLIIVRCSLSNKPRTKYTPLYINVTLLSVCPLILNVLKICYLA